MTALSAPPSLSLTGARLPRQATVLVAVVALAISGIVSLMAGFGPIVFALIAGLLFLIALPAWSLAVENRRSAVDRLMTGLVWSAFGIALTPLVSLL